MAVPGASAADINVRDEFAAHFAGFTGTFVMYDPAGDKYIVYNEPQSKKRLSPCSTFKIYNSLIGLETGVLDEGRCNTLFKWNGTQYSFPYWNHDHTLASATRESVVWYFQELAARIGPERMQEYIDKIGYGNKDISGGLTTFWLGSSLQISALEQVDLLTSYIQGNCRSQPRIPRFCKRTSLLSEDGGTKLMGKPAPRSVTKSGFGGSSAVSARTAGTMSSPRTSKPRTAPTAAKPGR